VYGKVRVSGKLNRRKIQNPNTKSQTKSKLQAPNSTSASALIFGACDFLDVWSLEFGIFLDRPVLVCPPLPRIRKIRELTKPMKKLAAILCLSAVAAGASVQRAIAAADTAITPGAASATGTGGPTGKSVASTSGIKVPVDLKDRLANYVEKHGPALFGAILILVAGFFVARWVGKLAMHWLSRKELQLEPPVRMLIVRLLRLLVVVFALVIAAGTAGVDVTALVASIGVAGLGVGLAMQGVLSNVVAGLTIIFTKPFRVGEYIEMLGTHGQVASIELFSTTLLHPDRSRIVIPNRKIVGEILHNYGTVRQLDVSVGVSYGTNVNEALATVREILSRNPRVLKEPAPAVGVTVLGDSSVNLAVKPWVSVGDFGAAVAEINQAILEEFRLRRIEIPFPQREIRLLNDHASRVSNSASSSTLAVPVVPSL